MPTPTPRPTPTPTPIPTATPVPAPTPVAVDFELYEDPEVGIEILYPQPWEAVKQESNFVWVRISDPDSDSRLTLFTIFHDVDAPPSERLDDAVALFVEQEVEEGLDPQVELLGEVALDDGSAAARADITHPDDEGEGTILHRIQVAQRTSFTYATVLTAQLDALPAWEEAFETMLSSLRSQPPAIYGVGHEQAFIMPLGGPDTMDPALIRETTSHFFVSHVFSGLVRFDSDLVVQPDLAEWVVDDTGTIYTFTMREGITFHDGQPITADDFKYSIERASDPELHSDTVSLYLGDIVGMHEKLEGDAEEVTGVEVVNERTLRITIDAPKRYFLAKLTYPSGAVVDRRAVEEQGEAWSMSIELNGSGPYMMEQWAPEVVVLRRFDGYHTPANIEYVVSPRRLLPGASVLDMYFGEAWDGVYVGLRSLDRIREDPVLSQQLHEFDQLTSYYVDIDGTRIPFDDPKVRRAFAMALDRERLVEELLGGNATLATGLLPPGLPGFSESLVGIPYDPEGARELLASTRYVVGLPPITITSVDIDGEPSSMVQFMVDSWRENLGVEVQVNLLDADSFFYDLESEGGHLYASGWVADYPDPENFLDLLLHSEAHDARYINKEFDELVERARVEPDVDARLALYREAEQLLLDDAGIIPLFHVRDYVLIRPHVEGFRVLPVGQPDLTGIKLNPFHE